MRWLSWLLTLSMVMSLFVVPQISASASTFSGGSGTSSDPYLISTADDLKQLATDVNGGTTYSGKYFKMTANIDLNPGKTIAPDSADLTSAAQWTPIGTGSTKSFQGNFNGDNHTISGVYVDTTSSYVGLFGCTYNAGISNVGVINSYIKGGSRVGGFVGYGNSSTYTNCYATGDVSGSGSRVGGFVGYGNSSTYTN
ncbi:MAG: hypothetical protein ACI4A5_03855, partial [Hominilimicola sp.]